MTWWLFPWKRVVWAMDQAEHAIRMRIAKLHNRAFIRAGMTEPPPFSLAAARAAAIVAVLLPLALALLWELVTDVGDNFEPGFYTAMAALMPLLLIAYMVEAATSMRRAFENPPPMPELEDDDEDEDETEDVNFSVVDQVLGRVVWSVAVSEFASLYALASGGSSAFLAALAVFPLIRLMPELLRAHRARFAGIRPPSP